MKKKYVLIFSLILIILGMSYVGAVNNDTNTLNEEYQDLILVEQQENENISISNEDNEAVGIISENDSSSLNETNDSEILGCAESTEILTIQAPEDILSLDSSVTPLSSSNYKEPTKKQRTFSIGGIKVVLSKSQYKKLYQISSIEDEFFDDGYADYYYVGETFRGYDITSTGLRKTIMIKTNKFVKVKLKLGKKVKYKKSRVYVMFAYGQGQCGVAYRHMMFLTHHYETYDLSYDYVKVIGKNAKYFGKCKHSASFTKLKKSKLSSINNVYKKYSVY